MRGLEFYQQLERVTLTFTRAERRPIVGDFGENVEYIGAGSNWAE